MKKTGFNKMSDWQPGKKEKSIKNLLENFTLQERKDKSFKLSEQLEKLKKIAGKD